MEKLLSIIVPSYNMEQYLPKCLGSLIVPDESLLGKLDVIVVNDGSKDGTSAVAHGFATRWPGTFRVLDKANGNYGSCINAALPLVSGEYVKVLDADDWFDADVFSRYLGKLANLSHEVEKPDLVLNDFDIVDGYGVVCNQYSFKFIEEEGFSLSSFSFHGNRKPWMHAVAYRTSILREIGYRQSEGVSYTDQEWISYPMSAVSRIAYIQGALYKYLIGREGQTCQRAVFIRSISHQMKVTMRMMDEHAHVCRGISDINKQYLDRHLAWRVKVVYEYAIMNETMELHGKLLEFDRHLEAAMPSLYAMAGGFFLSNKLKFHHVREWRKRKFGHSAKITMFKIYMSFAVSVSKILHILKGKQ